MFYILRKFLLACCTKLFNFEYVVVPLPSYWMIFLCGRQCLKLLPMKKDTDRRKSKGRHDFLGEHIDSFSCHASVFKQNDLKKGTNLSYSSYRPGEIKPILHIIIVQFIVIFISSWCISSYSSFHPDAVHPILHIILVQNR